MEENTFRLKVHRLIERLLGILGLVVIISIFFSERIAQHRMQALSLILGLVLISWGIGIIVQKDFVYPIKIFKKKRVIKKEGKSAKKIGAVISIIGVLLSIWGLLFWINFFRNI